MSESTYNNNRNFTEFVLGTGLLLVAALAFFSFQPGLTGPFLFDDYPNLEPLSRNGGVTSLSDLMIFVFGNESGSLGRPVSMLSFLINDNAWPSERVSFKYTNLLIHLINGLLVFCLSRRLIMLCAASTKPSITLLLPFFVATAWLLNPLHISTVLYTVQRMTQLSALFSLLAMLTYIVARTRVQSVHLKDYLLLLFVVPLCCGLAILSKENGILVLPFILLIEHIFFDAGSRPKVVRLANCYLVLLPLLIFIGYLLWSFEGFMNGYRMREFSMVERLLTQPRVILDYLVNILGVSGVGNGLFHDDFQTSKSLFQPISTLFVMIFGLVSVATLFVIRKRAPLVAFGGLFFLLGHSLEASFIPLEMYFEHRNYLPMIGVFIFISGLLLAISSVSIAVFRSALVALFLLYGAGASAVTYQSASLWGNDFDLYTMWATEHPKSLRAQRHYGGFLGRTELWSYEGMDVLQDAFLLHPDSISLPLRMAVLECRFGIASGVTLSDLNMRRHNREGQGAVVLALKELAQEYISRECDVMGSKSDIVNFLTLMAEDSSLASLYRSQLLTEVVNYYVDDGDLQGTIESLEALELLDSTYQPTLEKAYYLYTAGFYKEAMSAVSNAYERDKRRKRAWIYPSKAPVIKKLEVLINQKLDKELGRNYVP